jgi:predicted RNase H-like HicB family nuclease
MYGEAPCQKEPMPQPMNENLRYSLLIRWSGEDQAHLVTLPEWSEHPIGPLMHGDTHEQAAINGQESIEALVASARKHHEPLPQPCAFAGV